MSKQKLAIVSSYNDLCGNASYTKALAKGLSLHYDTTVISLNVELLRKKESASAKAHINDICNQLKEFDCVNIQFEAGLFGSDLRSIQRRFLAVAKSSKRLVVTMHRFHGREKYPGVIAFARAFLKLKPGRFIFPFKQAYINNRHLSLYNKVVGFCKRRKIPILVHTIRDRQLMNMKFNYDKVFDHPICFYDQSDLDLIQQSCTRKSFCEKYALNEDKIYIGVFGFITKYKGHDTIINALEFLPDNYELLIFGTQHPHTIRLSEPINEYVDYLVETTIKKNLSSRVKFYGVLNDDDFLRALFGCNFTVMPYLEVNQGGSAIAALSLETNSSTIFSQNCAFLELAKYAPDSFKMFTIGNYLELANIILSYRKSDFTPYLQEYHRKYNMRTSAGLYKKLLDRTF